MRGKRINGKRKQERRRKSEEEKNEKIMIKDNVAISQNTNEENEKEWRMKTITRDETRTKKTAEEKTRQFKPKINEDK